MAGLVARDSGSCLLEPLMKYAKKYHCSASIFRLHYYFNLNSVCRVRIFALLQLGK